MNVCSGWLPSFKKKMVHSQPTKAWDTHPAAEWQCDFAPYILQPWLMSDNIRMKKNGCRCTSNVQWARRLAWVFDYMPLFRGSMGGYKRRTMVPEDTDLGTRWNWSFQMREKIQDACCWAIQLHLSNQPRDQLFVLFLLLFHSSIW